MKALHSLSTIFFIFLLIPAFVSAQQKNEPKVYKTIADGTWTGNNWTPSAPPADLTNATIIIEHKINYTSSTAILNWNTPTGQILIEPTGSLHIKTEDSKLVQSKGFKVINNGKLKIDLGISTIKIEKGSPFINNGTMSLVAGIVDLNQDAFAQLISKPAPIISSTEPK